MHHEVVTRPMVSDNNGTTVRTYNFSLSPRSLRYLRVRVVQPRVLQLRVLLSAPPRMFV